MVRWMGIPARRLIVVFVTVFAVVGLAVREGETEDRDAQYQLFVGYPFSDYYYYYGAPVSEASDGEGGRVYRYEEIAVADDYFVRKPYNVYVNDRLIVYRIDID